jgi:hypothetical protein
MWDGQKDVPWKCSQSDFPGKKFTLFPYGTSTADIKWSWPFDNWLMGGFIRLFDDKGNLRAQRPVHPHVKRGTKYKYYKHPEGIAACSLDFDLRQFPGLDDWLKEKNGKLDLDLQYRVIEDQCWGIAEDLSIVCATRDAQTYDKTSKYLAQITYHEIGHVIGNVLKWMVTYDEGTAAFEDAVLNQFWYVGRGGVGNHCSNGARENGPNLDLGKCLMFHGTYSGNPEYCDQCQLIVKRADLTKLGLENVWGAKAWGSTAPTGA